jgi:hypothetical protein
MNRQEVTALVAYVTQLNPGQQFDAYTADAWHDVLGDVQATFDQARAATAAVAKRERWIYPSAIREELKTILRAANPPPKAAAIEAPSKFESYEDRSARIARNKAKVQVVLDAVAARKVAEDPHEADIPENLRHAREVARQYKRERDKRPAPPSRPGDPDALGPAGAELLTQINRARSSQKGN